MINYSKKIGVELKTQLEKDCDIIRLSRWAYGLYFDHRDALSSSLKEVLKELARMEDDPQFEYTEQELRLLAEMLINEETDPIKKINDARTSMGHLKHLYKSDSLKLVIEKDIVGFYLIVYKSPNSEKSSEDYLFGSLEEAFQGAEEKFGVSSNQWELQKS